jgi:hypothetical protein
VSLLEPQSGLPAEEGMSCLRLQFSKDPPVERLAKRSFPGRNADEFDIQVMKLLIQLDETQKHST